MPTLTTIIFQTLDSNQTTTQYKKFPQNPNNNPNQITSTSRRIRPCHSRPHDSRSRFSPSLTCELRPHLNRRSTFGIGSAVRRQQVKPFPGPWSFRSSRIGCWQASAVSSEGPLPPTVGHPWPVGVASCYVGPCYVKAWWMNRRMCRGASEGAFGFFVLFEVDRFLFVFVYRGNGVVQVVLDSWLNLSRIKKRKSIFIYMKISVFNTIIWIKMNIIVIWTYYVSTIYFFIFNLR